MSDLKHAIQSSNINFLFGSGISMPFLMTLGEVEDRLTELNRASCSDSERMIVMTSIRHLYFKRCIEANLKIITGGSGPKSVLESYANWLDSLNQILLNRKSTLLNKQVNLFTSNMDIFSEVAIESLGLEFNDGFYGSMKSKFSLSNFRKSVMKTSQHYGMSAELPLFNLLKIHGSLNWKISDGFIELDQKLGIVAELSKILIPDDALLEVLNKSGKMKEISDLLEESKGKTVDVSLKKFNEKYDELAMVNPTKEKFETTIMNSTYYELLRIFANELEKENSLLFVLGFSFADEHITEITKRVANSNPTLKIVIFAFDSSSEKQISTNLDLGSTPAKFSNIEFHTRESILDVDGKKTGEKPFDLGQINKFVFSRLAGEVSAEPK